MPFKFNPFTHKLDIADTGGGGSGILTITGNSGGAVGADGSNNINFIGQGAITVSGSSGSNTLTISSSNPFFSWFILSGSQMAISQQGYFTDSVSRVDVQLPNTSVVGDIFVVADLGGNKWRITQDSGQQVLIGNSSTTLGATGYLESLFIGDSVTLVCCVDNLTWMVVPASTGNLTIV
jgi:hypothetical protein